MSTVITIVRISMALGSELARVPVVSKFIFLLFIWQESPPIYLPIPAEERTPLRVLGLFDGIATGRVFPRIDAPDLLFHLQH